MIRRSVCRLSDGSIQDFISEPGIDISDGNNKYNFIYDDHDRLKNVIDNHNKIISTIKNRKDDSYTITFPITLGIGLTTIILSDSMSIDYADNGNISYVID